MSLANTQARWEAEEAYDEVARFLRNNLDDADYHVYQHYLQLIFEYCPEPMLSVLQQQQRK